VRGSTQSLALTRGHGRIGESINPHVGDVCLSVDFAITSKYNVDGQMDGSNLRLVSATVGYCWL
jgi:hypothetical protein